MDEPLISSYGGMGLGVHQPCVCDSCYFLSNARLRAPCEMPVGATVSAAEGHPFPHVEGSGMEADCGRMVTTPGSWVTLAASLRAPNLRHTKWPLRLEAAALFPPDEDVCLIDAQSLSPNARTR